jgi:hypothetical protein
MCRFTIRDVLWLTVVAALSVSWWVDNKRIENTLKAFKAEHDAKQLELDDKLEIVNQMNMEAQRRMGHYTIKGVPPPKKNRTPYIRDPSVGNRP